MSLVERKPPLSLCTGDSEIYSYGERELEQKLPVQTAGRSPCVMQLEPESTIKGIAAKMRYAVPRMHWGQIFDMVERNAFANRVELFVNAHPYFYEVCAGAKHHHWWKGGLSEHVKEMIGFMFDMLQLYKGDLNGKITQTDCIITALFHDFDKVWCYVPITDEDRQKNPDKYHPAQQFRSTWSAFNKLDGHHKLLLALGEYGIRPTEDQWSACIFAHGGYSPDNFGYGGLTHTGDTVMHSNPLAVLTSMADLYSSQMLGRSLV